MRGFPGQLPGCAGPCAMEVARAVVIQDSPVIDLSAQPYTARLAASGSRRAELTALLDALPQGAPPAEVRRLVVEHNVTGKASAASRQKVWEQLNQKYLLRWEAPEFASFVEAIQGTSSHSDQGLLCYLLFARTD